MSKQMMPDEELTTRIEEALVRDHRVSGQRIGVAVLELHEERKRGGQAIPLDTEYEPLEEECNFMRFNMSRRVSSNPS